MEMPAPGVDGTAEIGVRIHQCADLLAIHETQTGVAVFLAQLLHVLPRALHVGRLVVGMEIAVPVVAVDPVAVHQPVEVTTSIQRKLPQALRRCHTDLCFQPVLFAPQSHVDLAAIAAGCTPSQQGLLEQDDRLAATGKVQGGGHPGEATAYDADIRLNRSIQPFAGDRFIDRRRIVGRCVLR